MKRPMIVTLIGVLFVAVGVVGGGYHLKEGPMGSGLAAIECGDALAVGSGVFLLLGKSWARWLLLAWTAFHVVISAFDSVPKLAVHVVLFGLIGIALLKPPALEYFRRTRS